MRLTDDFEEESKKKMPLVYMTMGVSLFVTMLLGFILYLNREEFSGSASGIVDTHMNEQQVAEIVSNPEVTSDGVRSEDLAIWTEDDFTADVDTTPAYETQANQLMEESALEEEEEEEDPSANGTKTMIVTEEGEEWISISPYIDKNEYDMQDLTYQIPEMQYYVDGTKISTFGIDLNEKHAMIDFNLAKKDGVDFAMIQLGSRGYESGTLTTDSYFKDYIKGATDAGIDVGVYFSSQAITEEEVIEEVAYIVEQIGTYTVSYPVVLRMDSIAFDNARTDDLEPTERTELVKVFVEEVEAAGYIPMLYGSKEFLLQSVELSQLEDVDIWLSNEGDLPDYPYEFHMWQYNTMAQVDGIVGMTNLNISFLDYTKK
ncbi:MAG: GH25 family lysozyme [Eubacteriales bacterium]